MNENLKLGLTLMAVTLIAALALAITNEFTAPQIEIQKELATKESLNTVMSADSFNQTEGTYEAYNDKGESIGKVFKVEASGYSSIITALVGIDTEGRITGVDIVSQQETPGLGANVEKESFLSQYIGKIASEVLLKKDGGTIDAITGATISSRALTNGIKAAIESDKPATPEEVAVLNSTAQNKSSALVAADSVTSASPAWDGVTPRPSDLDDEYEYEDDDEYEYEDD